MGMVYKADCEVPVSKELKYGNGCDLSKRSLTPWSL